MLVLNMLEKIGNRYLNGNIKLVRIKPEVIEVRKTDGTMLLYWKNGEEKPCK